MSKSKNSQQPVHRATVIYVHEEAERTYCFASLDGSDGSRASNVWIGNSALNGHTLEVGDRIDLVLHKNQKTDRPNRSAWRVWKTSPKYRDEHEHITTLHGADEYL